MSHCLLSEVGSNYPQCSASSKQLLWQQFVLHLLQKFSFQGRGFAFYDIKTPIHAQPLIQEDDHMTRYLGPLFFIIYVNYIEILPLLILIFKSLLWQGQPQFILTN